MTFTGQEIAYQGYSLKSSILNASANLTIEGKSLRISYNQETQVTTPNSRKVALVVAGKTAPLATKATKSGISFTVPAMQQGMVLVN